MTNENSLDSGTKIYHFQDVTVYILNHSPPPSKVFIYYLKDTNLFIPHIAYGGKFTNLKASIRDHNVSTYSKYFLSKALFS